MKTLRRALVLIGAAGLVAAVLAAFAINAAFAAEGEEAAAAAETAKTIGADNENYYMAVVLSAALAAGFGFLGAGYAVARVGAAAMGAASERPEILMRSIVLVALGESIAIFGALVAMLLVLKLP